MLKIGPIQLDVPFVQAAMSGYSDLSMCRLARRHGAPYVLAEAVLDRLVLQRGRKQQRILGVRKDDHPVGGQLLGADPEDFAPAAIAMVEAGYDVIDINFACPVRKVLRRHRGGFLLTQPDIALRIVQSVHDAVGSIRPVTVKMRRGMDDTPGAERDFFRILDGAFEIGVSAVTVHGRTVVQRYAGRSRWSFLTKVKQRVGEGVILGSGDLFDAEACVRMIRETGVDGVTIARGCVGNPWIFQECRALWQCHELPPAPSIEQQRDAITEHWSDMLEMYGETQGPRIMRKHGIKYSEHHPLARQVRDAFIASRTLHDIRRLLDTWYDPEIDWPPVQRREWRGDLSPDGAAPQRNAPPSAGNDDCLETAL